MLSYLNKDNVLTWREVEKESIRPKNSSGLGASGELGVSP